MPWRLPYTCDEMAFTVNDFRDLIELLAQHPEWRTELRRHVLSDELLELPSLVRQLVEAQERTESTLRELGRAQTRTEDRLARVESAIERLADSQRRTEDRVGDMDGRLMELDFARKGPAYLSPIARRLRVIEFGPLADLLDEGVDDGRLTEADRDAIMRTDIVMSGRRRRDGQDVYLVVEISGGIGTHDVERAMERAALLRKLGRPVVPIVAGRWINDEAAILAHERGVWSALGGLLTSPNDS
jgi:hypothetical protein